ncbi:hypothetical protein MRX96_048365, partial [Rhipicephalus microplus]
GSPQPAARDRGKELRHGKQRRGFAYPAKRQKGGVRARDTDSKHCSEKWVRAQHRATELIIDVASP